MDAATCPTCEGPALAAETVTARLEATPTIDLTLRCEHDHRWTLHGLDLADATQKVRGTLFQHAWIGASHASLGLLLEVAGKPDDAYEEYATAFRCNDFFDRGFCHERLAAYQAQHGWLRNALQSLRDALAADRRASGARVETYAKEISLVEAELTKRGIRFFPADSHDKRWQRDCELEFPPEFGARNELGEPLSDDVIEIERLIRAERWDDAVAALQALGGNKQIDAIGFASNGAVLARRAGQQKAAIALQRLVIHAYAMYASGATSGGEGMARMADVHREEARLREWEAET